MQKARKREILADKGDRGVKRAGEVLEQERTPKHKNTVATPVAADSTSEIYGAQTVEAASIPNKALNLPSRTATTTLYAPKRAEVTPTPSDKPLPTPAQPATLKSHSSSHGHTESGTMATTDPARTFTIDHSGPRHSLLSQSTPSQSDLSQTALGRSINSQSAPNQSASGESAPTHTTADQSAPPTPAISAPDHSRSIKSASTVSATAVTPRQSVTPAAAQLSASQPIATLNEAIHIANGIAASPSPVSPPALPAAAGPKEQQAYHIRPASEYDLSADPVHKHDTTERCVKDPDSKLDFQLATDMPVHMWPHNIRQLGLERWIPDDCLPDPSWKDGLVKLKGRMGRPIPLWWAFMYR